MTSSSRDAEGYPLDGLDAVPDRQRRCNCLPMREQLTQVMALLQDANERNNQLLDTVSKWKKDYALVRDELLALKYRRLCTACQLQRLSLRDGQCLEVTCTTCDTDRTNLLQARNEADDKARYWQRCYESLLEVHYGQRDDDGADGRLF